MSKEILSTDNKVEPIAIIGMACRFPGGADSPQLFWNNLCNGTNAVTDIPASRWSKRLFYHPDKNIPGKIYAPKGGFLNDIDKFDPEFFGLSPREASFMDPQHRVLLETTWEAIEDAGINPKSLAGSNIGVFVGLFMHDYENIHSRPSEIRLKGAHSATGTAVCIAANRISYLYDFTGPSMVIDTACSSSLIAIHLACQSIRSGESEMAVAGGVNIITNPEMMMALCKATMLSPDGYSKTFDIRANGYARAEGAGMLVLKKLSDAVKANDPIWAVIKSTSTNQDGKSDGQTVPSSDAQKVAMRKAIEIAGITPKDISYFEAHGTGTTVGDPIEARAIGGVISEGREEGEKCIVGSLKTNIGHSESAAGVASIIKAAMMLKYKQIPPNLHFETPNPNIPFEKLKIRVPTSLEKWERKNDQALIAGINSFGFGGSNACAILEEFEKESETNSETADVRNTAQNTDTLIPLSAHKPEALDALAASYLEWASDKSDKNENVSLKDIAYSASLCRGHHHHRLTIPANTLKEFKEYLKAFTEGEKRPGMSTDERLQSNRLKIAFIFSGMGQQWWAMGRELLENEPVFRKKIEECDALFKEHTEEWSLIEELTKDEKDSLIDKTRIAQPAIFALQLGLMDLWKSKGIVPDAIAGHSVGEVAACYASGVLSLKDAVAVSFNRSKLQQTTADMGKMLAIGLSPEDTEEMLSLYEGKVSIAAVNSPTSITIAGDAEALEDIAGVLEEEKIFARFLKVEVPYHSPVMDSILPDLKNALKDLKPQKAQIPFYSTVTGELFDGSKVDGEYWCQNVRQQVSFQKAITSLSKDGHNIFIEIGAHPVLAMSIKETLNSIEKKDSVIIPSLRRKEAEKLMFLSSLGKLYCIGYPLDWTLFCNGDEKFVKLPLYPWQRDYYWMESDESKRVRIGLEKDESKIHPLLGEKINSPVPTWSNNIDLWQFPYLKDHVVQGSVLYPAAAYVEMGIAAAKKTFNEAFALEKIEIKNPLLLPDDSDITIQLSLTEDAGNNVFSIYSKHFKQAEWTEHIRGTIDISEAGLSAGTGKLNTGKLNTGINIDEIKNRCSKTEGKELCYKRFHSVGLEYGPDFQLIELLHIGDNEVLAEIKANENIKNDLQKYIFHPALLDVTFQALASIPVDGTYVPVHIESIKFFKKPESELFSYGSISESKGNTVKGDIIILDTQGNIIASVEGLACQYIEGTRKFDKGNNILDSIYENQWVLKEPEYEVSLKNASEYLPSPSFILDKVGENIPGLIERYGRKEFYSIIEPQINGLCVNYIVAALKNMGYGFEAGIKFTTKALFEKLNIIQEHKRLFNRLLEILKEDNILRKTGDEWEAVRQPEDTDPQILWNEVLSKYPDQLAELTLIDRCGSKLDGILRGEEDPLSIIFPVESLTTQHLYQNAPTFRIYNQMVKQAVSTIIAGLPKGQTLRVLEVGAGTGSLSSYVLPLFSQHKTEYIFSDITAAFTKQAKERFKDYDFVDYKILDIEKNPLEQGYEANSFDIILASDAVHATSNLTNTLSNIKKLIAPDGLLMLLEATKYVRWFDIVFGTLKGWWLFSDSDIRKVNPLLSKDQWKDLFEKNGFEDMTGLSDEISGYKSLHNVLITKVPMSQDEISDIKLTQSQSQNIMQSDFIENAREKEWIILSDNGADNGGIAEKLEERFNEQGINPLLISQEEEVPEESEQLYDKLERLSEDLSSPPSIINLWSTKAHQEELSSELISIAELEETTNKSCAQILNIVQALMKYEWKQSPDLYLVTNGAQAAPLSDLNSDSADKLTMEQTPVIGLGRVAVSELANLKTRMIDLSPRPSENEISNLFMQLISNDAEDEIALRDKKRYVQRFVRRETNSPLSCDEQKAFKIYSSSEKFLFQETKREKPDSYEIEVNVKATGFNARDIAKISGTMDAEMTQTGLITGLGLEYSGIVTKVGDKVTKFKQGDEVLGFSSDCLASYITADSRLAIKKSSSLNFEEAATMPTAFLTAYYALNTLAKIQKNERVLIHTASDGTGLAAIQTARATGAQIFATADTSEKRDFLKTMGINYVGDSASPDFYDEITKLTGGKGLDIVINTLPDKRMLKSLDLLKPVSGRFINLSNTSDSYSSLNLNSFKKGTSFFAFDLEQIARDNISVLETIWDQIVEDTASGKISPLPHRALSIMDLPDTFKDIKENKHIGKITLSFQEPCSDIIPVKNKIKVEENGTYLMSGGLGGFGLATAKWLVACGAKHLILLGRSGDSKPEAKQGVQELRSMGAEVFVGAIDITKEDQLKQILSETEKTMPPLRGVIHGAMVLEDVTLDQMKVSQMKKVLDPKVLGAWNLHKQTLNKQLDFFISFSSFTSLVGNAAQGNYAAGNAYLDALSHYRKQQGLPGNTISWGSVGEVGYVAEHEDIDKFFRQQGISQLSLNDAWKTFAYIMDQDIEHIGIIHIDWKKYKKYSKSILRIPRFSGIIKGHKGDSASDYAEETMSIPESPEELEQYLNKVIVKAVADVLGTSTSKLNNNQALERYGLDSLMAVELNVQLKDFTGINLPKMTLLQKGLNINELIGIVRKNLSQEG